MQPSRRAFLLGRRPPGTPWDAFRRRLERTAQGRVDELEPGPNGRALLQPARREDVRHARALCQEYGVALLLHGADGAHVPALRPVLYVDPSLLVGLVPGEQPGQWHAQAGCRLGELADAGLPQFAGAPEHATLAAWLAGPHAWAAGATADSGVAAAHVLLSDGTAETLGPFGASDQRPLRSATVQQLVPTLFRLSTSADAANCRQHAGWACRYRLDALLPAPPAEVNLAQLLLGHGGSLAWVEEVLLVPGAAAAPAPQAADAPAPDLAGAARRLEVRMKDAFDPIDLYAP